MSKKFVAAYWGVSVCAWLLPWDKPHGLGYLAAYALVSGIQAFIGVLMIIDAAKD